MKRIFFLILIVGLVAGCGATPTPAPDLVATQVAVMAAAAATLTADAPAPTPTPVLAPTDAPTTAPAATAPPTPSPLPTATRPPRATPTPVPPPAGPSLGRFAVVNVRSDDVLNVRVGPGADYAIAGTIPYYGRDVDVLVGGQQAGDSWWVPVQYGSVSGWANNDFLARQAGYVDDPVAARAAEAIMALKDGDMEELGSLVHPDKGVRFSPYATVNVGTDGDLVFSASQVRVLMTDPTVYRWGIYDGSGLPIEATCREYYAEFVYDVDFVRPDVVGFNERVGPGSTIDNTAVVYPGAVFVEYHFEGFEQRYEGMDWRTLRLIFEEKDGTWYLVGITHDEWTV